MQPEMVGLVLAIALLAGFGAGWAVGKAAMWPMPNVPVATLVLVAGSLGGPAATYHWLGANLLSYISALAIAGASAGLVFWPMGETQGRRRWL